MANIYTSASQLIGHTPLLELGNLQSQDKLPVRLLAKLEAWNPAGSAKDRVALNMIDDAEKVKVALQCIGKHHENDRWLKPVAMAAIKMAVAEGSDAGKRYLEADKAQQIALGEIMEQYGDDAKRAIRKLLQDNQRRAMTMNGAASRTLQEAIGTIADHI